MCGSVDNAFDWGLKACYFKTHYLRSHCALYLSRTLCLLLVMVQSRKTGKGPNMTEKLLNGTKSIKKKKTVVSVVCFSFN